MENRRARKVGVKHVVVGVKTDWLNDYITIIIMIIMVQTNGPGQIRNRFQIRSEVNEEEAEGIWECF